MSRRNDLDAKTILILLGVAFIYGLVKGIITLFEMIGQGFVKLGKGICNFFSNISYSINNYIVLPKVNLDFFIKANKVV